MDFQFVFDETGRAGRSRRRLWSHGAQKDGRDVGPAGPVNLHSSPFRGLGYGLPISLLLWAVIAFAVWAMWLL